jgi:tetratricopeptide (TPR) repeat protein
MSTRQEAVTTDLRAALDNAAKLLRTSPTMAESQAREILGAFHGEINASQLLGAALRAQGRYDEARKILLGVVKRAPDFALAQQEFGLTLLALGDGKMAERVLASAVNTEPKLAVAWKALGDVRRARGDQAGSEEAYRHHLILTAGHPDLVQIGNLLYAGKLGKAEQLCRAFLYDHPTNVSAIRMMADLGMRLGRLEEAQNLLERCLELAPDFHLARNDYANVLNKRRKYEPALVEVQKLLQAEPNNPNYFLLQASMLVQIGEFQSAIDVYERVLTRYPRQPRAHMSNGHALKTVGRQDDAIEAYRTAIRLRPGLGEAYWSLANLKTFRFEDEEIRVMREQVAAEPDDRADYFHLCFALGKALEDRQEYDEAFSMYDRGNRVRRETVRWDADNHHRNMRKLIKFFDAEFFTQRAGQGCESAEPIFIVGLPRAGSTLLEQILASHSEVEGTMELPDIMSIARRLSGKKRADQESNYPDILAELTAAQLAKLGDEYLDRTRIQRSKGSPFFIDKMPNNFSHVGLIQLILPNAKIIDARRHPLAGCFSGFKQLFASGQNFTYSLEEIGRYYRDYVELMDHWDRALPGRVLRVQYENVVTDLDAQVRRMLDYCGLPFEDQCLEFHETERAVRTASSEQVRQPLYGGAVDQWRHFETRLGPLTAALGPVMDRYPVE